MENVATIKVLMIDDDVDFLQFLKDDFNDQENFEIYTASSEQDGLSMARMIVPDVILLDVMMPKEGGLSVLQKLKADSVTRTIPVVMLTAVSSFEARLQALRMYCEGYIEKPCSCIDVVGSIDEVFKRREEIKNRISSL